MHDIWNPWHGCIKKSEGCDNCYMYYLDRLRNKDGQIIYKTKTKFNYPLQKNKNGEYKIKSGEKIRICMTSDFFLQEADNWRKEVWKIIKARSDVIFYILTKRPERVEKNLPEDWKDGYENVFFNVTCENQLRADERIPILLKLPFKHKGIMVAPFIDELKIDKYLKSGQIEEVVCGGENYNGARICDFEWVKKLHGECKKNNVSFCFIETGTKFKKDGKIYYIPKKSVQAQMAFKANLNFVSKKSNYKLTDCFGQVIQKEKLYKPKFSTNCFTCGSKQICNGCSFCSKCGNN